MFMALNMNVNHKMVQFFYVKGQLTNYVTQLGKVLVKLLAHISQIKIKALLHLILYWSQNNKWDLQWVQDAEWSKTQLDWE